MLRDFLWTVAAALAFLVIVHLAGGWYFSSMIDDRALSASARRASLIPTYQIEVLAVGSDTVRLKKPGEARLTRNGTFGLTWNGGWGIVGDIVGQLPDGSVVRSFQQRAGTQLIVGELVSLDPRVYQGDPLAGVGIPFTNVTFAGELGEYPAWFVPGSGSTWFVFVHGNGMTRLDGLRILPAIVRSGMPALLPTYRGDEGAPEDSSGRLSYGKNEWRDVEAAVRYALDHGAHSVVLEGVSMGGGIVTAFLLESPLANRVSGVVLDSPILNFQAAVEFQADREGVPVLGVPLPGTLVDTAEWLARVRFGVDWDYTDYLARADELNTPIMLIHGTEDETIPVETTTDLARLRPDIVRDVYVVQGAGHVESWNADPETYEKRVVAFLAGVGALP